jgi:hypothetical protein
MGVVVRYAILFPLRLLSLILGFIAFFLGFALVGVMFEVGARAVHVWVGGRGHRVLCSACRALNLLR